MLYVCKVSFTIGRMKSTHKLNNRVREYRAQQGMTQTELAVQIGVTRQTIFSIEKGKYTPSVVLALRIAETFAASVEDLFQLVEEENNE